MAVAVLWVEGAIDVLAARALARASGRAVIPLGIPGGNGWVTAWRRYGEGRGHLYGLDDDTQKPPWARSGDRFAARIAIDCTLTQEREHRPVANAFSARCAAFDTIDRDEERGAITGEEAARRRQALGPLTCVLCGVEAVWLCEGCGRRRPRGAKDWGEVWEKRIRR